MLISPRITLCAKTARFVNKFAHDEMIDSAISQEYLTICSVLGVATGESPGQWKRRWRQQNIAMAQAAGVRQVIPPASASHCQHFDLTIATMTQGRAGGRDRTALPGKTKMQPESLARGRVWPQG
ncbi:hypothetical protein [Rhodopila globiformis]|uniref:hypothetical protein n=1 Tax=Rhodopila globiformis TaxID=1071 RepID=UPI0011B0F014|nr:hypothetical protein [Rhodopila globiformis]